MFHTFQSVNPLDDGNDEKAGTPSSRASNPRRISTSNACTECRRRKTRCGGQLPCQQCQLYRNPELCTYTVQPQRPALSRRLVERLQGRVDGLTIIANRLFPGCDVESLLSRSRDELLDLAASLQPPPETSTPSILSEAGARSEHSAQTHPSEGAGSLAELDHAPQREPEGDESMRRRRLAVSGISDDVNGLSLSADHPSSYLGISSINAALKIIFKLAPGVRSFVAQSLPPSEFPSRIPSPSSSSLGDDDASALPPPDVAQKHIEAYFAHVHVLMPMIDEDEFRHAFLYLNRHDSPWLALLNIILALGCLASGDCTNEEHIIFYKRASKHLTFASLGSSSLAVLQALGLLSGYYLHWLNRPNEANALMGATLRMATVVGLHREYPATTSTSRTEIPVEIRRRTWWSLVCLDTLAGMTTGRPSLGRVGHGVSVQAPKVPEQTNNAQYLTSLKLLPSSHNVAFCRLATRIQDKLAAETILNPNELATLDAELVAWHNDLPPILREDLPAATAEDSPAATSSSRSSATGGKRKKATMPAQSIAAQTCPEILRTPRAIMHWWYMTLRMLMHRPVLLAAGLRTRPCSSLTPDEKAAVDKCRHIASQIISSIATSCRPELIAGWNAVWIIYQAVMVPLISLWSVVRENQVLGQEQQPGASSGDGGVSTEQVEEWRDQVRTTLDLLDRMVMFSLAGRRIKIVVEKLFEASLQPDVLLSAAQLSRPTQDDQSWPAQSLTQQGAEDIPQRHAAHDLLQHEIPPGQDPYTDEFIPQDFQFDSWHFGENQESHLSMAWDDMLWQSNGTDFFAEPTSEQLSGQGSFY